MTQITPVDILAIGAHPDDQELSTGGTLLKHQAMGWKIGLLDLTRGEMGTLGTPEIRKAEALGAAEYMGADWRVGLDLTDGFLRQDDDAVRQIISVIRAARPRIVLANAIRDRHTDHGKGATIVHNACYLSGLRNIKTDRDGVQQSAYRPSALYHYIQDYHIEPDLVVDISEYLEPKMELVMKYRSQFYDPTRKDVTTTPISGEDFLEFLRGRAQQMGRPIGVAYGEGFTCARYIGVKDFSGLL